MARGRSEETNIAIPEKGRTASLALHKLASIDVGTIEFADGMEEVMKRQKRKLKEDEKKVYEGIVESHRKRYPLFASEFEKEYPDLEARAFAILRSYELDKNGINRTLFDWFEHVRPNSSIRASLKRDFDDTLGQLAEKYFPSGKFINCKTLFYIDNDSRRQGEPLRVFIGGFMARFGNSALRVSGMSHYDIPKGLESDIALAFVGFDELLQHSLKQGLPSISPTGRRLDGCWATYNARAAQGNMPVRIVGSAGLNDFAWHNLLFTEELMEQIDTARCEYSDGSFPLPRLYGHDGKWISYNQLIPLIVVAREYDEVYHSVFKGNPELGYSLERGEHFHTEERDIEGSLLGYYGGSIKAGVYITQSGKSAKKNKLTVVGMPFLMSNTKIAVNFPLFNTLPVVMELAKELNPLTIVEEEDAIKNAYGVLVSTLTQGEGRPHGICLGTPDDVYKRELHAWGWAASSLLPVADPEGWGKYDPIFHVKDTNRLLEVLRGLPR